MIDTGKTSGDILSWNGHSKETFYKGINIKNELYMQPNEFANLY
jgi:hypothetical protein